jgi:hypothetical protein
MKRLHVDLAMRIATEHLSYRALIEEIETDLEHVGRGSGSFDVLKKLIRSFSSQVRGHFALEEKGGLFEVYGEHDFDFRRRAQSLREQHRDFLERLRSIQDSARTIERFDGPEFERFSRELRELIAGLRQHELDEDELLERLVDQDIRGGPRPR